MTMPSRLSYSIAARALTAYAVWHAWRSVVYRRRFVALERRWRIWKVRITYQLADGSGPVYELRPIERRGTAAS